MLAKFSVSDYFAGLRLSDKTQDSKFKLARPCQSIHSNIKEQLFKY